VLSRTLLSDAARRLRSPGGRKRYDGHTSFAYDDSVDVTDVPECTPTCDSTVAPDGYPNSDALPAGECAPANERCILGARGLCPCADAVGGLNGYYCECVTGRWSCVIYSMAGRSSSSGQKSCVTRSIPTGQPMRSPMSVLCAASASSASLSAAPASGAGAASCVRGDVARGARSALCRAASVRSAGAGSCCDRMHGAAESEHGAREEHPASNHAMGLW
jgi:hypothetical protein